MNDFLARRGRAVIAACALIGFAAQLAHLIVHNSHQDLFIYRSGSALGFRGHSPYDSAALKARVAEQYPHDPGLIENCGFFLAPQSVVVFAPFVLLPWPVAKWLWTLGIVVLAAISCRFLAIFAESPKARDYTPWAAMALLLNPFTGAVLIVGQTTLFVFAMVVLGEVLHRASWKRLGCMLWACAFIKPHLALPLIPLAWFLGGWKRSLEVLAWVLLLNVVGCLLASGSLQLFAEYLEHLRAGHKAVEFNRAELNPQISSWNRLLIGFGGPIVELSAITTLAGYAVWFALIAGRVLLARAWPSPAWVLAASATGAVVCCQVLPYELGLLTLAAPLIFDWATAGRKGIVLWFVISLVLLSVPFEGVQWLLDRAELPEWWHTLFITYRSAGALGVALGVLGFGWPKRKG